MPGIVGLAAATPARHIVKDGTLRRIVDSLPASHERH